MLNIIPLLIALPPLALAGAYRRQEFLPPVAVLFVSLLETHDNKAILSIMLQEMAEEKLGMVVSHLLF
jgi:hypothetical protein